MLIPHSINNSGLRLSLTLALLCCATTQAQAGEWSLNIGGFYSQSDTNMQVTDPLLGNDFDLDFESDLQLAENEFLPLFELGYRFNDRHHIYFDWKQLHRSAETQAVSRPFQIQIDDTVYDVKAGGQLGTTLNIDIARIGYGYDLFQGNGYNIGVSVGLHTMFIESSFEGSIGACATSELSGNICSAQPIPRVVDESVTAPLPNIGLFGDYELAPGWQFNLHAQYFSVRLNDLKGSLVDIRAGMKTTLSDRWDITLAYNYYKVDVDVRQSASDAAVKVADYNLYYSFIGPMLSISYRF